MTNEQFSREKNYQVSFAIFRFMLKDGFITEEELKEIELLLIEKYQPLLGTLYAKTP